MANIFQTVAGWFGRDTDNINKFNRAVYQYIGGQSAQYDYDGKTYLEEGFGKNPIVFAIINQQADKTKSVPYYIKKIKDNNARKAINQIYTATKGNLSIQQQARIKVLETKAFESEELPFPMEAPNPTQTWTEVWALYKVYMKTTGNFYLYIVSPDAGNNAGKPRQVYVLPSHLMKIVLKKNADLLNEENPISHYMLIEGNQYIEFEAENVIHVKYANPFFDMAGSHLYGLSPIRAALRNIESTNDALDHNVKTMKNSGVFGFLSSADINKPWTPEQAFQAKQKLIEMDRDSGRMGKIAAGSGLVAFTKLSLNTDELKPFEFLKYDMSTLCNVLGWSDILMNSDSNMTYNNVQNERKRVITDNIQPDLQLLSDSLNKSFIPRFGGNYQNAEITWDITELPEMQEDYKMMVDWMNQAPLTPNEIRTALKYETIDVEGMDIVWVPAGKKRIDDESLTEADLNKAFNDL